MNLALTEASAFLDRLYGIAKAHRLAAEGAAEAASRTAVAVRSQERQEVAKIFGADLTLQVWALGLYDSVRKGLEDAEAFHRVVAQIRPFELAWRRHDRARRRHHVVHAVLEAALGLVVGVIAVELISDRLQVMNRWFAWAFAVVAWVVLDYVLSPVLDRAQERQRVRLVTDTLQRAQFALVELRRAGAEDGVWVRGWARPRQRG
jgi:hypothetical protein